MKLVVASNNKGKIKEIKEILKNRFDEVLSLEEAGIICDAEETGKTFYENALIKAYGVKVLTEYAVIADDSGLEVTALNYAPGIYSARYSESGTDEDNNKKLLSAMEGENNRQACFKSVVVLIDPEKKVFKGEGVCRGEILNAKTGNGGFGYDPLFYSYDLKKSFGEATPDEKNSISHRKAALVDLLRHL